MYIYIYLWPINYFKYNAFSEVHFLSSNIRELGLNRIYCYTGGFYIVFEICLHNDSNGIRSQAVENIQCNIGTRFRILSFLRLSLSAHFKGFPNSTYSIKY
jgi:hypothetical protein